MGEHADYYTVHEWRSINVDDNEYWTTKAGATIKISKMGDTHLINTISFCIKQKLTKDGRFKYLIDEAAKRRLPVPHALGL